MAVKTQRKAPGKPVYKLSAPRKTRASAPKNTSKSIGKLPLAMYEHLHIGVVQCSPKGQYTDVNEEFCRMLGYSKKELLQLSIRDCTHEDDYALDVKLHEQLIAGKIPFYELEKRFVRKDGKVLWVELTRSLVRDVNRKPLGTLGIVIDVSDRKDVERVLRDSSERLRLATEVARMFMWELDLQKRIYTFADNFEQVLGFSAGLLPKNSVEIVQHLSPAEDVRAFWEAIERAVESRGDLRALQIRVIDPKDGRVVWLEVNGKIVYDEQGRAQHMFGTAQNITENRNAQEEIRILSRLPSENPNPVMRLTPEGGVLYANEASKPLLKSWEQQNSRDFAELQRFAREAFESGSKKQTEIEYGGKVLSGTLAPVQEAGYINFYGSDITERKKTERVLAEYARQQEALYQLSDQLHRTNLLEGVYNASLDAILRGLQCDRASILLFDDADVMRFVAWRGLSEAYRQATEGHSPWRADERNPYPICVNEIAASDLSDSLKATIRKEGIASLAFIPLVSNGKLIGKFMVYFDTPHDCSDVEIELGLMIARQLAFGIERKRAEERLRESEERLRVTFNTAVIGFATLTPDARFEEVNDAFCQIVGYTRDELLQMNCASLTHPFYVESTNEHIAQLVEGRINSFVLEKLYVRKDGTEIWVQNNVSIVRGTDGLSQHLIAICQDITERKQSESKLRANETLYRTIARSIPGGGVYVVDKDFRYLVAEGAVTEAFGLTREMLEGHTVSEVFHDERAARTEERLRQTFAGEAVSYETRHNGRVYWTQHAPLNDSIGQAIILTIDITERKQAEEALRQSEERFSRFMENLPGLAWIKDVEGHYVYANAAAEKAFGTPRAELYSRTDLDIFPAPIAAQFKKNDEQALLQEQGLQTVETLNQEDGVLHYSLVTKFPIPGPDGKPTLIGGTAFDITERLQAEEALRIENERFMRFIDSNIVGILIGDAAGKVILANDYYLRLLGVSRQDFMEGNVDWKKFTSPEWLPADERAVQQLRERGVCDPYEKEYIRADGTRVPVYIADAMLPGPREEIAAFVLDITERKRAEEALRESEERLKAILNQATAGIVRKDAQGRLIFVNQAYCDMLGYSESELLGKTFWQFTYHEDVAENKHLYDRMMAEGTPFKLEKRVVRKDGSILWIDASVSPVMDVDGKPQSAVAVEVDITGRKQAEEALQQLNLQLESRVQKRTATIQAINQSLREEILERKRIEEALRLSEAAALASEEKLRTLFDLLPVGISFLDPDGRFLQMNSALPNILKLSRAQLLNQEYKSRKYIRADGSPMPLNEFASARALRENKTIYNVETGIVLESGEVVWTSISAAPVDVADVGVVVVTVDTTESKRAERALQESHGRLRILSQRLVEVQEEERRALARELHDRVGQTLAALNINLIIINGQLSPDAVQQIGARLNDSMKLVGETIALVRDVMTDLRPAVLDDYGLEAALEAHLNGFRSRYNIQVAFEKPEHPIPRLGPSVEMTFLRIAQEALMNIARHAHAEHVNLSLRQEEAAICLTIQDDGIGIESWQDANRPGSHGLTIMRERADAFGGALHVRSTPGQGTVVDVSIPLPRYESQAKIQKEQRL